MEDVEDTEDDQFFFSHAPRMPEYDIIMSEVALLTGGRDQHGRPIVAFPAKYHGILESKVKASGMETLLRYYVDITRPVDRKRGLAFVTDLRFSTLDFILLLKSTLNSMQAELKGAIGTCVLYVLLPLNKKTHKNALTHLALRLSKKKINKNIVPPYFQCVAVDDEMELYNYIEKSHLTQDLGGYLQYTHQDWVTFRKIVEPFLANFESVQLRLPIAFQRILEMGNVAVSNNRERLVDTHRQLQDAYDDTKRSLHLDEVIGQCEDLLPRFNSCDEEDVFTILAQKPIFKETKETIEGCYEILMAARRKIDGGWSDISRRFTQAVQLMDYRADVNKLLDWFRKEKESQHSIDIAESLSRAEMLCNHYETGPVIKAQEKLSKASSLVQKGETMAIGDNIHHVSDIMALAKTLKEAFQDFQGAVQRRQEILQSVYRFHQLYNKARRWYVNCIRFLPSDLPELFHDLNSRQGHNDRALRLQWEEDVRRFLHKYPLLEREELKKIKAIPEVVGAAALKKKGRLLSYRCLTLTNLLSHNGKTSSSNVKDTMKWRREIHSQSDDWSSQQNETPPSTAQMRKAPSDSSLDAAQQNHRHKKHDSKRQSRSSSKSRTAERNDSLPRSRQVTDEAKRHDRHRDKHSDTNSNTANETDNEDPLMSRLGNAASFYNRVREAQVPPRDEIDVGQRENIGMLPNHVAPEHGQSQAQHQNMHIHNGPLSSAINTAQTYGIYGDSDFEDDTAVVIHRTGPQGLHQDMLPGNQMQHHHGNLNIAPSVDPTNISVNQTKFGLMQPVSDQLQHVNGNDAGSARLYPSPQLSLQSPHLQQGPVLQNGSPSNFNANNNSFSNIPHSTSPYNHPTLSLPQRPYGNSMTSRQAPISFHGSLMNIHQSHMDDGLPTQGGDAGLSEVMNSSPVSRHRSMMHLSQSPIENQEGIGGVPYTQTSPLRTFQQQVDTSQRTGVSNYADETGLRNSAAPSRLRHGVSEPNVNVASLQDNSASPYRDILASLTELRERTNSRPPLSTLRLPRQPRSKKATRSPSQRALSQSEMDLRSIPQYSNSPLRVPGSLAQSELNLRQDLLNSPNINSHHTPVVPTHNASSFSSPTEAQAEYYKKLQSTSSPNSSSAASGHQNADHTLDPSLHTWMHDVPPPQTRHQSRLFARLRPTTRPLSPLSLLELEVAKDTMDAEQAIQEDEDDREQSRRQIVIESILNQSRPRTSSQGRSSKTNPRSSPERSSRSNDRSSKKKQGRGRNEFQSLTQKADKKMLSKSSPNLASPTNLGYSLAQPHVTGASRQGSLETGSGRDALASVHRLAATEHLLGLSTTLPQHPTQEPSLEAAEHQSLSNGLGSIGGLAFHSPSPAGVGLGATSSVPRGREPDWRQEHLRELGLSPHGLTARRPSLEERLSPAKPLHNPSGADWRQQHLKDLGISPGMNHSSFLEESTSKVPPKSPSNPNDADWRRQHLLELGLSPGLLRSGSSQVPTTSGAPAQHPETANQNLRLQHLREIGISPSLDRSIANQSPVVVNGLPPVTSRGSEQNWRQQHLRELGISPSFGRSVTNQNPVVVNGVSPEGSQPDWRRQHLNELGISPSNQHYPFSRTVSSPRGQAGSIAPVTSKLRGVIGRGQSLNGVEDIHRLADEHSKKSVRFAHPSDNNILDAEEEVQEELALRLRQLELKFQEEENSLSHQFVLDEEELTLDHQLRDLDRQENGRRPHVSDPRFGFDHQVVVEGAVRPNQPRLAHRVSSEGSTNPNHVRNRRYDDDNPSNKTITEGAIQPTHIQSTHQVNLEEMLGQIDPLEATTSRSKHPGEGNGTRPKTSRVESVTPTQRTQNTINPSPSQHDRKLRSSDKAKMKSYPQPTLEGKGELRDGAGVAKTPVRSLTASPNIRSHGKESISVNSDRHLPDTRQSAVSTDNSRSEIISNSAKKPKQYATSKSTMHNDVSNEVVSASSRPDDSLWVSPGILNGLQGDVSLHPHQLDLDKAVNRGQKASEDTISASPHQIPDRSTDLRGGVEGEMDEALLLDEMRQSSLSDRDHTPADYIACALGMDYINDKSNLTVQPYTSSSSSFSHQQSNHLDRVDDLNYLQAGQGLVGGTSPSQGSLNHSQMAGSSWHGSAPGGLDTEKEQALQGTSLSTDGRGDTVDARGLPSVKDPHVRIPSSLAGVEEGPCSPIRQWLKEKETMETGQPNHPGSGLAAGSTDKPTAIPNGTSPSVDNSQNPSQVLSPTLSSNRTSPIREWLREKQAKEAHEGSLKHPDFSSAESPSTDGNTHLFINGSISGKMNKKESPTSSRGRSTSLIPVPVGSRRMSDVDQLETKSPSQLGARRKSGSSIPVYKGLVNSSPPKTTSSSTLSDIQDDSLGAHRASNEDISAKRRKQFSKIPVSKVYSALKDGGYLQTGKSPKEQSPSSGHDSVKKQQHDPLALERSPPDSKVMASKGTRPVLEKQGTFTKEPRPGLTRDGTFTIDNEDGDKPVLSPKCDQLGSSSDKRHADQTSFSPLALVLDHMVKRGVSSPSSKPETQNPGKKRHDSVEEPFENSSTESSMSPTTKSVVITSKKPTTNLYSTKNYYISAQGGGSNYQNGIASGKGPEANAYEGLTESDRREHEDMDDSELERMMVAKSQLAEIRNLEIENRHLAYERKEFEAQYMRSMHQHDQSADSPHVA